MQAPRVRPSRRSRGTPRARVVAIKNLTRQVMREGAFLYPYPPGVERPRTRGECREAPRPCPFVSCKHHLYLDVDPRSGSIKLNYPTLEPWDLEHTCSLDIADRGGTTLDAVGELMNLTRERIRQVEVHALLSLRLPLQEIA